MRVHKHILLLLNTSKGQSDLPHSYVEAAFLWLWPHVPSPDTPFTNRVSSSQKPRPSAFLKKKSISPALSSGPRTILSNKTSSLIPLVLHTTVPRVFLSECQQIRVDHMHQAKCSSSRTV
ncbi:hypothetical protein CRE_00222 [Caenorhabditis remanei]|uniref:Uncharacterized protein n=1 Tax=Caenorhabditis remanei TaxID=31234 RepID=E3LDW2_CAERE|nr:hypothetical protein CRE_00222 [Caenorhabditis remanei]